MARTRPSTAFTCSCIILFFIVSHSIAVGQELHNMPLAFELDWVRSFGEIVDIHDSDNVSFDRRECRISCRNTEPRPTLRTSISAQYDQDFCLEVIYTFQSHHDSALVAFGWAGPTFSQSNVFAHRRRGDCGKWTSRGDVPDPLPHTLTPQSEQIADTLRVIRTGDKITYYLRSEHVHTDDAADVHVSSADVWISVNPGTTVVLHSVRLYQQRDPIDTVINFGINFRRISEASFLEVSKLYRIAPFNFDLSFYASIRGTRPSQSLILGHRDSTKTLFEFEKGWFRSPVYSARPYVINWASADGRCILVSTESADLQLGLQFFCKNRVGWRREYNVSFPTRKLVGMLPEATISPDMKTIIFSGWVDTISMARDLWITFYQHDSVWSDPVPLGGPINTLQTEGEPFISADGKYLYFSSDGHPGFGCADIFVSERQDTTWTTWSKPQNLGRRINTVDHEYSLRTDELRRIWFLMQRQPYSDRYVTVYRDTMVRDPAPAVEAMPEYPAFQRRGLVERVFCDSSFVDILSQPTEKLMKGIQDLRATLITYPLSTVSILYNVTWDKDSMLTDSSHVNMCHKLVDLLIRSGIPAGRLSVAPNYDMLYEDEEYEDETLLAEDDQKTSTLDDSVLADQEFDIYRQKMHKQYCFVVRFQ